MINENLKQLNEEIIAGCREAGRDDDAVTLVAVSKLFGTEKIEEAYAAGQRHFGENYAQEFRDKYALLNGKEIIWHYIGTLQTNKVKYVAGNADYIHSVDSVKILAEISKRSAAKRCVQNIFFEFKSSFEETKSGSGAQEVFTMAEAATNLPGVRAVGLMTMAPFVEDEKVIRDAFRRTRLLKEELNRAGYTSVTELSMGMTGDFKIAIEEGSTYLRIGTAIFGERS